MPLDSRDYNRGSHPPACTCADCVARRQGGAVMTCPMCEGRGSIIGGRSSGIIRCPTCQGTKFVTRESYRRVQEARRREQYETPRNQASVREALDNPQSSHYEVLGVPSDASDAAIRDSFRRLARVYHPDRDQSVGATGRYQRINRAYQVLSDRTERASYNSLLERERRSRRASQEAAQRDAARRTAQRVEEEVRRAAENAGARWDKGRSARTGQRADSDTTARQRTERDRSRVVESESARKKSGGAWLGNSVRVLVGLLVVGGFGALVFAINEGRSGSDSGRDGDYQIPASGPLATSKALLGDPLTPTPLPTATPVLPTPTAIPTPTITPTPSPTRGDRAWAAELAGMIHQQVNIERARYTQLGPLAYDARLNRIAAAHSQDMGVNGYFSHTNLTGQSPSERGEAVGYLCRKDYGSYYTVGIAENIHQAWTYGSYSTLAGVIVDRDYFSLEELAQSIVQDWMDSPGHRENILEKGYDREGIGVFVTDDEEVYTTQNFC